MSTPGVDVCAYCKQATQDLERLNNPELVEMMRENNPRFARASKLCATCKERAKAKLLRRKRNEKLAEQKAARSTNDKSTSYSNRSDNPVLSQSSSNQQSSTSSNSHRTNSRNVAKRTGGRPTTRNNSDENSEPQPARAPGVHIDLFRPPPPASTNSSRAGPSSQSSSNHDDSNSEPQQPQNISYASISISAGAAPMPQNRTPRSSQSLSRPPSPQRMLSSTSEERSQEIGSYRRGHGG